MYEEEPQWLQGEDAAPFISSRVLLPLVFIPDSAQGIDGGLRGRGTLGDCSVWLVSETLSSSVLGKLGYFCLNFLSFLYPSLLYIRYHCMSRYHQFIQVQ